MGVRFYLKHDGHLAWEPLDDGSLTIEEAKTIAFATISRDLFGINSSLEQLAVETGEVAAKLQEIGWAIKDKEPSAS